MSAYITMIICIVLLYMDLIIRLSKPQSQSIAAIVFNDKESHDPALIVSHYRSRSSCAADPRAVPILKEGPTESGAPLVNALV